MAPAKGHAVSDRCPWRGSEPARKSLLFARAPSLGRASLRRCRGSGLVDQKVFPRLAFLDGCGHPARHRTSASPSFSAGTTVFRGDRGAFQRTAAATAAGGDVFAKRGKLPL